MSPAFSTVKKAKFLALACLAMALLVCLLSDRVGHVQTNQKGQDPSDVLRVYTEIVQTDVMVFDKQGRFVDGLKSSDFELRIDGTPKQVEFFEKVTAGSVNEEMQIAAARGSSRTNPSNTRASAPLDRGRPIFFFVDDLHLDLSGWQTYFGTSTHRQE